MSLYNPFFKNILQIIHSQKSSNHTTNFIVIINYPNLKLKFVNKYLLKDDEDSFIFLTGLAF